MNWLPAQGPPGGRAERIVQTLIRLLAVLPVYTATVVTLTLALVWVTR